MSKDQVSALLILVLTLLLSWQLGILALHIVEEKIQQPAIHSGNPLAQTNAPSADYETEPFRVALTFDDGPHPVYTKQLLDGLAQRGIRATFFLIGENIPGQEELVLRMAQEGHMIGNHTYHHVQMAQEGILVCGTELDMTNVLIESITGTVPEFVRPPFGQWSRKLQDEIGMIPVGWDVDPLDWKILDADRVADSILKNVENGDIILLHDVYPTSVQAAFLVMDALLEQGCEFVTADELIVN